MERGHKLLKEGAILTYILPEGLFTNTEYKYIRKYLTQKNTILEIGLFTKRVFDASVDTAIILIKNIKNDQKLKIISDLNTKVSEIEQEDLNISPEYIFPVKANGDGNEIIKLIEKGSTKLIEFCEVQQGIIYSGRPKEEVFANEQISPEYKKILDGRDITRFKINWGQKQENRFIKYTKELHRPREERIFTIKEKVILPRRSTRLVCALDDEQFYLLNTGYVILPKNSFQEIKYILAILNSKLMNFYYKNRYFGWQITIPALNALPIRIGSEQEVKKILDIVDKIIEQKKSDLDITIVENLLNSEIYKIYNIDEPMISLIEDNL